MSQSTQDFSTAGRIQPSQFDTVLPPDARAEMLKSRRPVIFGRPSSFGEDAQPDRSGMLKWAGGIALVAIILAGAIGHYSQGIKQPATPQHTAPIVQPTPAQPASQPLDPPPPTVSAPRARLVLYKRSVGNGVYELLDSTGRTVNILVDPAPRAQLVRLPPSPLRLIELTPEHIDESHRITMPYGTEVRATLRGFLENENQLPRIGHIGDMYVVGNIPWIWIRVPGTSSPTWVDP